MITTSLTRLSNNYKALFPSAVGEIRNLNVNGNRIDFELQFYADEEARQLLSQTDPNQPFGESGIVLRQHYSEEVSIIESYSSQIIDAPGLVDSLKACCELWLIDKHYPEVS